jgi:uncharacterized phiE125 gp8 family phage protein
MGALTLVTPPAIEPVTMYEVRRQCKVPDSAHGDDALLEALRRAARERGEAITGRQFIAASYRLTMEREPCDGILEVPRPPLISIDAFTYLDFSGASQSWASSNYQVEAPSGPYARHGRLAPKPTTTWPLAASGYLNALTMDFTAGYGTTVDSVPDAIRLAILLMVAGWYVNREDMVEGVVLTVPVGALALLTPYKVHR